MTEHGMMNSYWTKIKLRAAAKQAIVIFHWVVGNIYLNSYNLYYCYYYTDVVVVVYNLISQLK